MDGVMDELLKTGFGHDAMNENSAFIGCESG